ncbi:hypothetical protein ABBQ32_001175 [Trebouxia sp. C0010 RCD-2024]
MKAQGLPPPSKSPAVRVHINVESNKPPAQEVIRKVTQAHEVVEVDGFVFKRKRPVLPSTTEQHRPADKRPKVLGSTPDVGSKLLNSTPGVQPALASDSSTPATAAEADLAADIAAVTTPDAKVVSAATTALLEQLPTDRSEPDRLASLCELLCAAELDELSVSSAQEKQLDPAVAAAIRQALSTFVHSVQSNAAAGRFQVTPSVEVQGTQQQDVEEDDGLFSVDLEARKAGLRAQLAVFVKEEAEWHEVLAQQDSFQRAAEPPQPVDVTQAPGKPALSPHAVQGPGGPALGAAQAAVPADATGRDSEGESMQADVRMPAATHQTGTLALTHLRAD